MSLGGGYSPPPPSEEERELMQAQEALYAQQSQYLTEQSLIQEQEQIRLMRDESVAAAEGVETLSRFRREGLFGASSLVSAGYGGFARYGFERPVTGGVLRTYTPPKGVPASAAQTTTATSYQRPPSAADKYSSPEYSLVGAFRGGTMGADLG